VKNENELRGKIDIQKLPEFDYFQRK